MNFKIKKHVFDMNNNKLIIIILLFFILVLCSYINFILNKQCELIENNIEKNMKIYKENNIKYNKNKLFLSIEYDKFSDYISFLSYKYPHCLNRLNINEIRYIYDYIIPKLMKKVNLIRIKYNLKPLSFKYYSIFIIEWINKESNFNKYAISPSKAYGLLQIKYSVWKKVYNIKSYKDLFDVKYNLEIGTNIFLRYLDKAHGYIQIALQMYNAGIKNKEKGRNYAFTIMRNTKLNLKYLCF